jgi:hypothetical protein
VTDTRTPIDIGRRPAGRGRPAGNGRRPRRFGLHRVDLSLWAGTLKAPVVGITAAG